MSMRWCLVTLAFWSVGCGRKQEELDRTQTARERYCTSLETAAAATDQQLRVSESALHILAGNNELLVRRPEGGDGDALLLRTTAGACASIASAWGRAAGYADVIRAQNDALERAFVDPPGALRLPEEMLYEACAPRVKGNDPPPATALAADAKAKALATIEKVTAERVRWVHDCEVALTRCETIGWHRRASASANTTADAGASR